MEVQTIEGYEYENEQDEYINNEYMVSANPFHAHWPLKFNQQFEIDVKKKGSFFFDIIKTTTRTITIKLRPVASILGNLFKELGIPYSSWKIFVDNPIKVIDKTEPICQLLLILFVVDSWVRGNAYNKLSKPNDKSELGEFINHLYNLRMKEDNAIIFTGRYHVGGHLVICEGCVSRYHNTPEWGGGENKYEENFRVIKLFKLRKFYQFEWNENNIPSLSEYWWILDNPALRFCPYCNKANFHFSTVGDEWEIFKPYSHPDKNAPIISSESEVSRYLGKLVDKIVENNTNYYKYNH